MRACPVSRFEVRDCSLTFGDDFDLEVVDAAGRGDGMRGSDGGGILVRFPVALVVDTLKRAKETFNYGKSISENGGDLP